MNEKIKNSFYEKKISASEIVGYLISLEENTFDFSQEKGIPERKLYAKVIGIAYGKLMLCYTPNENEITEKRKKFYELCNDFVYDEKNEELFSKINSFLDKVYCFE